MKKTIIFICFGLLLLANLQLLHAQNSQHILMTDVGVQVEATQAVNNMYNFKFDIAEKEFQWFKYKYAWHPLPYFLLGLSEWWKIMPNIDNTKHDDKFMAYMDTAIFVAQRLYDKDEKNIEAAFFLSAAYGFKARLYSERKSWRKAAWGGKNALSFLNESRGMTHLSPEFLFGDAIYNYYSVWIPENYPVLKPILMFFDKGDKNLGINQLREVAMNAFYTRTEAQYFLMRIYALEENDPVKALPVSEYLAQTYPDNPYFQRFYARLLYSTGRIRQAEQVSMDILAKIDSGMIGYEATSGRYAAFYLGYINETFGNTKEAKHYYQRAVAFGEEIEAYESGYFILSLLNLAKISEKEKNKKEAKHYYQLIKKYADRKHPAHKQAREYLRGKK